MNGVTLRVFSGIHLGAEIELEDGAYVMGSDDSCDLIFGDSSLVVRHAVLRVTSSEKGPQVTVEPLDGPVTLNGEALQQEQPVLPRRPFSLGQVLFAWTETASAGNAAWQEVEDVIARAHRPAEAPSPDNARAAATTSAAAAPDANNAGSPDETAPLSMEEASPAEGASEPPRSSGRVLRKAGVALAVVLLGMLSPDLEGLGRRNFPGRARCAPCSTRRAITT